MNDLVDRLSRPRTLIEFAGRTQWSVTRDFFPEPPKHDKTRQLSTRETQRTGACTGRETRTDQKFSPRPAKTRQNPPTGHDGDLTGC
jgi:hypothetical protein